MARILDSSLDTHGLWSNQSMIASLSYEVILLLGSSNHAMMSSRSLASLNHLMTSSRSHEPATTSRSAHDRRDVVILSITAVGVQGGRGEARARGDTARGMSGRGKKCFGATGRLTKVSIPGVAGESSVPQAQALVLTPSPIAVSISCATSSEADPGLVTGEFRR